MSQLNPSFSSSSSSLNNRSMETRPLSISELTQKIKRLLETQITDILVEGEISGFKSAASGHMYFDLKDSGALIHCVVWAGDVPRLKCRPSDGMTIEARGRLTVYDQRGQYQLTITSVQPAGLGKLYQAFMEMKERLAADGLFDPAHKKPIPPHPRRIGLVTSPTGAAIQDMLNILTRRAPHIHVIIYPARVQGDTAAKEIAQGINRLQTLDESIDVIIVGRGGGSLEDLWAFNEEIVARAIWNSRIPVISAVGHETDTTIADFVADMRAPTPSAAAELVARDSNELLNQLTILQSRVVRALREQFAFLRQAPHLTSRLESAMVPRIQSLQAQMKEFERSYGIQLPIQRVNQSKQLHDDYLDQLNRKLNDKMHYFRNGLARTDVHLGALNPKAILKRGYSITYNKETSQIVGSAKDINPGAALNIILGDGQIEALAVSGAVPARRKSKKNATLSTIDWFGNENDESE